MVNIDPDALIKKHEKRTSKNPTLSAGKEALAIVNECIESKQDFSIETTLASKVSIRQIKQAKSRGYKIVVIYVGTTHVAINLRRIAKRVENGGHDIPEQDVVRRHTVSRENLIEHFDLIDTLMIVDNSEKDGELFATVENGHIHKHINTTVTWGDNLLEYIRRKINKSAF